VSAVADAVGRKVRVFGRVQGVFFRQWAINEARALGVDGWVHNARDGSVEAHLEGSAATVAQLIEHMRRGPPQARVEDLTVDEVAPEGIEGFSVRL
jgi:acylphosphatase